ncbi:MAG: EVE domain-containing protein [Deltaproteobacteria bacterium]|nr:EVE domain-containing protein [Deltaproteobacteria bacterium]
MSPCKYWLMKSEPSVYGIADLERDGQAGWEGVRNYQARNFMRDEMKLGDLVLFYHSNSKPSGVAGLAKVVREAYPDAAALDRKSEYFDPKATADDPRWVQVDLGFVERFDEVLPLEALKDDPKLAEMLVVQRGQRLSIQPVTAPHFRRVLKLAGASTRL